jgi:hypothetical protein
MTLREANRRNLQTRIDFFCARFSLRRTIVQVSKKIRRATEARSPRRQLDNTDEPRSSDRGRKAEGNALRVANDP